MCDMGYIIADHVTALMQVVTNELPQYNMQVITTKCLNTAVMIMYLFLGRAALEHTDFCDVTKIRKRHTDAGRDSSLDVLNALIDDAIDGHDTEPLRDPLAQNPTVKARSTKLSKPKISRVLYYVMVTNGTLPAVSTSTMKPVEAPRVFPGHVFVIERLPRHTFNLYQSYIRHFQLNDLVKINSSLSLSHKRMTDILHGLRGIFMRTVWDTESTVAWKKLSHVDEARFEGHIFSGNVHMCYTRVSTDKCIGELRTFVARTLAALIPIAAVSPDTGYGNTVLYAPDLSGVKVLSNAEMLADMLLLQSKL